MAVVAGDVAVPYGSRNLGLGGRPKGTTLANQRAAKLARKKTINWVVMKYAKAQSNLTRNNERSRKHITLEARTRERLVARAIVKFEIKDDFDVPRLTIHSRIKVERLELCHTGTTSPIRIVEMTLNAYIINSVLYR